MVLTTYISTLIEKDKGGEYKFIGHGKSVIEYSMVNRKAWSDIKKFEIKVIGLDHLPLEVVCMQRA